MSETWETREIKLEKNRLESLTDGIFAFAMTLLVTSLILPRSAIVSQSSLAALISLIPDFYHYIIGFFVLAAFWVSHHMQFRHIQFIDRNFLSMSLLGLFLVTLVPFSTSFIGDYSSGDLVATVVFELNLMILGLVFALQWYYSTKDHRLVSPELPADRIVLGLQRNLVIPGISAVAIITTFAGFDSSTLLYMTSPVVSYLVVRHLQKR